MKKKTTTGLPCTSLGMSFALFDGCKVVITFCRLIGLFKPAEPAYVKARVEKHRLRLKEFEQHRRAAVS